jgi:succinate-semialdehyde dehydrogenase/glutarate-semialdehyde dehydrogenase
MHVTELPEPRELMAGRTNVKDGLKNAELFRTNLYIGGTWTNGASGETFTVSNPATGAELCQMSVATAADADAAVASAAAALEGWQKRTAQERADLMMAWFELIRSNADDLARIMTLEQGKPLAEARGEVMFGASFVRWYAEEGKRVHGEILQTYRNDRRVLVYQQPVGVVVAITPWNFPSAMITRKCAPALAAGCTVVLKPAEDTPLSALALAQLAAAAGIPPGVISVIPTSRQRTPEVGAALLKNPSVRKVSFTGSTATGKLLMRQAADQVLKVSLELGGNAPLIVFDDADLGLAIAAALGSKFRNTGQTCTCANRILVQSGIHDRFVDAFKEAVKTLRLGNGLADGVTQGPLINQMAMDKVRKHVEDAVKAGARVVAGGRVSDAGALFYEPTILTNVAGDARVCQEETFGPVAPIVRFDTEAEAVEIANNTRYGLAAYFFTSDLNRTIRLSEKLEFGAIGVNEAVISSETVPIGGMKESGIGREGAHHGIHEFLETKQVTLGGIN